MAPVPAVPAALPLTHPQLREFATPRPPGPAGRRSRPQINIPNQPCLPREIIAFAFQMNWKMLSDGFCPEPGACGREQPRVGSSPLSPHPHPAPSIPLLLPGPSWPELGPTLPGEALRESCAR